jgi:hypothetical protein
MARDLKLSAADLDLATRFVPAAALGVRIARLADDVDPRGRGEPDASRARRLAASLRVSDGGDSVTFCCAFVRERTRLRSRGKR